jgi:uncharacterized membrane protein YfcA
MAYLIVACIGLIAGAVSGVIGTGSSMILMPFLVAFFGPQQAVPMMAIGAILGNLGKVLAWRRDIDWRACGAYCSTAAPGAALGVRTLLALPPHAVEIALGLFFIAMIPARRRLARRDAQIRLLHLALAGGVVGFLTGVVVSTGPITVPVFTAYGLAKGAFLATEAAGSLGVYIAKVATFKGSDALPARVVLDGLIAGSALMAGSWSARRLVLRLTPAHHALLLDALMLASGLSMLWAAWHA